MFTLLRGVNRLARVAAVAASLAVPSLHGAVITEALAGTGDLPGTAQSFAILTTTGILGTLAPEIGANPANKVDMYSFFAPSAFTLSAMTVGGAFRLPDPQLFLFSAGGVGVLFNNDRSITPSDTQAELASALYGRGTYYLAISMFAVDPVDAIGAYLFDTLGSNGGGPVNFSAISGWLDTGAPNFFDDSQYEIQLGYTAIPEPSTFGLMLLSAGALAVRRKLRR